MYTQNYQALIEKKKKVTVSDRLTVLKKLSLQLLLTQDMSF